MNVLLEKFIESEHLPLIELWEDEKEIFKYLSHSKPKFLREKDSFAESKTLLYMIRLESNFIGTAWLEDINHEDAKLGIYIADISSRGKGIGEEVVRKLIEIASKELSLNSIYLNVRDYNERAIRCYSKCGFRVTKKTSGLTFSDGSCGGAYEMTLLLSDLTGGVSIKYTSIHHFIFQLVLMVFLYLYVLGLRPFDVIPIVIILIVGVPITSLFVCFRDYKIIMDDKGLVLFNLFKRPNMILWSDIMKIEVKKSNRGGLYGMETIMTFYTENSTYNFNVYFIDNKIYFFEELMFEELMKNCISRNIEIVDLTGDVTKFFTEIELRLYNFICKLIKPLKKDH